MESSYLSSPDEVLDHFNVQAQQGLSEQQVRQATQKYGRNGTTPPEA